MSESVSVELSCVCCALWVSNGDESGCRDFHGHKHPRADFGGWVVVGDGHPSAAPFRCVGCGALVGGDGALVYSVSVYRRV